MKRIIGLALLTLALSVLASAQTPANTKTICKGEAIPEGYTIVGETNSSNCSDNAWVIKARGTPKLALKQSVADGSSDERPLDPASSNEALQFAKKTATLLTQGDLAVEKMIDWENLKLNGTEFGAILRQTAELAQKDPLTMRRDIIKFVATAYKESREGPLNEWRVRGRRPEGIIVAATSSKGETVLFTVSTSEDGRQIITAIAEEK